MTTKSSQPLSKEDLKRRVFDEIDARSDEIVHVAKAILQNPEPGFREVKTSKLVAEKFAQVGVPFRAGLAITGVRTDLIGGSAGPALAILGELDSAASTPRWIAFAATKADKLPLNPWGAIITFIINAANYTPSRRPSGVRRQPTPGCRKLKATSEIPKQATL